MENKQLQQAKENVAKSIGWKDFSLVIKHELEFSPNSIIDQVALEYHRLMSEDLKFIEEGTEIIAKDVCLMDDDKIEALIIGKQYKVKAINNSCIVIKSEWSDYHRFEISTLNEFFRPQPPK